MGLTLCVSVTTVWYVCLGFVLETAVCDMSVYAFVLCGRPKLAWVYMVLLVLEWQTGAIFMVVCCTHISGACLCHGMFVGYGWRNEAIV